MSTAQLKRPRRKQALLSDQTYCGYGYDQAPARRQSAPPITMEASQSVTIPFGNEAFFEFDKEPSKRLLPLVLTICEFGDLPANWNSYGASPIDVELAAYSIELLFDFLNDQDPLPSIVPTSRGGVMFEWHTRGVDLEVDVRSPSSVHVSFEADGREEEVENADFDLIQEKLNILRGRL